MQIRSFLIAALAAGTATAHMNMKDPPPLAYKGNPNSKDPNIDYSITSPLTAAQYPCKGYLKLLGTPEGAPVKTYTPGGQYSMSVEGGAAHNGGSCQLSLSYDKGASFTVIKSFIGNCPTSSGGTFNFNIPSDAPTGDEVVFAWTWVNHTGNREFYMSCAVVSIKGGASKRDEVPAIDARATTAFSSRPKVFVANLGGQYCTKEGVDTVYPEPGPDVENTSTSPGPAILCSSGADVPSGSTGGSGSGSGSSAPASSAATSAAATSAAATSAAATSAAASSPASSAAGGGVQVSASISGGVFVTVPPSSTAAVATSAPATSAPAPSTFSTATKASSSIGAGTGASTSAAAGGSTGGSATTSAKAPVGTGSAGNAGGATGTQSGACTNEGAWSCAPDGSSFQRCASGLWSAAIPMAQGTKCSPGVSNTLSLARRRDRVRRSGTGLSRVAF
ncbi:hypothetical protein F5B19DRAFT_264321 [Rostrohypoxylon terebratum]|nr:hypothetical protein F5B19DRAFT_264321 [Rostrohypoxylon terebratum]